MIEQDLTRIADALEKQNVLTEALLNKFAHIGQAVEESPKKHVPVVETPTPVAPTPPAAPVASVEVSTPHAPVTPPPVQVAMTPEELNAALVVEFGRLKSRDPIDAVMRDMNVTSIHDLKPEQYSVLLEKVRAV